MISFQRESFAQFHADAEYLFPMHYQELALYQERFKQGLFIEKYIQAEKDGILHVFTARDNGHIVGYYIAAVVPHLHYRESGLMASTDMYFLHPEYRKGNIGLRFMAAIENSLKAAKAGEMYISCKVHADIGEMLEFRGFDWTDKMYRKQLIWE